MTVGADAQVSGYNLADSITLETARELAEKERFQSILCARKLFLQVTANICV